MGCSSPKNKDLSEFKYFKAFSSIKQLWKNIINSNTKIDDVYLINIETIPNFLKIFEEYEFFKLFIESKNKSDLEYNILKKLEGSYEQEKNIEVIELKTDNYEANKDKKFIFVDIGFLGILEINLKNNEHKKLSINISKGNNRKEKLIEIVLVDNNNPDENKIIKIIEERKGIFKFDEMVDKSLRFDESKVIGNSGEKIKEEEDDDDDMGINFRIEKNKNTNVIDSIFNDNNYISIDINNNNYNNINNNGNINSNYNNNNISIKKIAEAPIAKLDEIISLIFFSISNLEEKKDIIVQEIQKNITELKINNNMEENDSFDIIKNIEKIVINLLETFCDNQNLIDINNSSYSNDNNSRERIDQQNILMNNDDEKNSLLIASKDENMVKNQSEKNPFKIKLIKIINIDKCFKTEKKEDLEVDYYTIIINEECYNLNDIFKIQLFEKCQYCGDNMKYNYQFKETPDILIIKFDEVKKYKHLIKFNLNGENIDLKSHLIGQKVSDNVNYELIKVLYMFDKENDNQLYYDINEDIKQNYIPYIMLYKKIK